jgi:hypothetical protein
MVGGIVRNLLLSLPSLVQDESAGNSTKRSIWSLAETQQMAAHKKSTWASRGIMGKRFESKGVHPEAESSIRWHSLLYARHAIG